MRLKNVRARGCECPRQNRWFQRVRERNAPEAAAIRPVRAIRGRGESGHIPNRFEGIAFVIPFSHNNEVHVV